MPALGLAAVEVVALLIALAAVLLLGAFWVFARVIESVLGHLPVVGRWAGHVFTDHLAAAITAVAAGADAATAAVAHWFYSAAVGVWHILYQLVATLADAKGWALHAYQQALTAEANAVNFAAAGLVGLSGTLEGDVAGLEGDISRLEADLGTVAAAAVAAALVPLEGAISDVQSEAVRLFGQAEAAARAEVAQAEALAHSLADSVQSEAVRLFGQAEAGIRALDGEVAALPAQIEGVVDNTTAAEIARALAGAGVAAIPGLLSHVAALTTEVDTCLEPLCDTVTPNASRLGHLGDLLKGLEALGLEALFVALAAECLTDPAAVVEDVSSVGHAVADPALAALRDLIGA